MKEVGKSTPIQDAALKVTGQKRYVGDMKLPGMLYGKVLFSPIAHGRITRLDTSKAESYPGVHAVATYKNTSNVKYNSAMRFIDNNVIRTETVFSETVRFVGDRIAAVAAESEEIAAAALKLIEVEYEELPVITDVEEAIKEGAYPIHEGGNIVANISAGAPIAEDVFSSCDHVIEGRYTTQAIHHTAIEPHCALADWDANGKLTVYAPSQDTFAHRCILSEIFDLTYNNVRVVAPAIGGAFGGKLELTIEPCAAQLSKMTGRPVRIVLTRKETITASRVRHPSVTYIKTGFNNDGRIQAVDFHIYTNTGAYTSSACNVAGALTHKVFPAYKIPNIHITATPVYTNCILGGAMRGYGSPQIYFPFERHVNDIAHILGKDPAEVQELNMVDPDSCDAHGNKIGNPRPKDALIRVKELIDYDACKELMESSKKEDGDYIYGIGLALGVHGNNCFGAHRDNASLTLRMNEDGSCVLYTGSHDMGTDTIGMQTKIISDTIGISRDRIGVVAADTDTVMWHIGDYSSRGTYVIGKAALLVAEKLKKELQIEAASVLGCEPDDVELADNMAWSVKAPETRVSLREVMIHCQAVNHREISVYHTYEAVRGATSYGVHAAYVKIDKNSGEVKVEKYAAVQDVGKVINPLSITGQLQGALHMGLGYALTEEISYNEKGQPGPLLLKKYGALRSNEMPVLLTDFIGDKGGEPEGPYGAKALGECPVVPVAPTVVNAICNALDIEITDLPASKERVLAALAKKAAN